MEYVQPYGGRCCVIYAPPTEFEPFLHHHTTELDAMEVRWRLFARDVLSLVPDDAGVLYFGRPPRPVRGLRLLGVVVHRARRAKPDSTPGAAVDVSGDGRDFGENTRMTGGGGRQSSGSGGSAVAEGDFGLVSIDDGTGVVEVRLPLRLWEAVALWDQVDIVGTPERAPTSASTLPAHAPRTSKPGCVVVNAEGCYAEADPNVAPLRALECINLYKSCYFSRAWSPFAVPLPPLLPDPQPVGEPNGQRRHRGNSVEENTFDDDAAQTLGDGLDGRDNDTPSLEARLLELIGTMGRATGDQLATNLGLPLGHAGVASALGQMQLDGVIYLAQGCYMPL